MQENTLACDQEVDQEKKKESTLSTKRVRFKKNDNDQEKRRKELKNAN